MIRPDVAKWGQALEDLRQLAIQAPHHRTRERFLALYMIASSQANATQWAESTGREDATVMGWVHKYNESGPNALSYRRTGGTAPFLHRNSPRRSSRPSRPPTRKPTACLEGDGR